MPRSSEAQSELVEKAQTLGVSLTEEQATRIILFCELLDEYNQHTNLVSRSDLPTVMKDHVLDALALVSFLPPDPEGRSLVDVGSGAGFPAIILACAVEDMDVLLVESTGKKCHFMDGAINRLGLSDRVIVSNERAEELAHKREVRSQFDIGTARAVGHLSLVSELVLPFLREGGILLAQKSAKQAEVEIEEAQKTIAACGGTVGRTVPLNEVALDRASVVIEITKTKPTPGKLPRTGAALKKPM